MMTDIKNHRAWYPKTTQSANGALPVHHPLDLFNTPDPQVKARNLSPKP